MERGNWKPNIETSPACPRCGSSNTKFCYYNNYSLTQPRYFCKSCRRYWTKGGSLRNVPVGGGCRKSRRPRSSRAAPHPTPTNHTSRIQTSSSTPSTPIDLATVYANFLNQPPPPPTAAEIVIPPHMNQLGSYLPENNGFFECGSFLGGGGSDSSVFGGFPTAAAEGFGGGNALPPLPEAAAVMWPSSEMLLPLGQGMIGGEVEPVQENLNGLNLEAIFRS